MELVIDGKHITVSSTGRLLQLVIDSGIHKSVTNFSKVEAVTLITALTETAKQLKP